MNFVYAVCICHSTIGPGSQADPQLRAAGVSPGSRAAYDPASRALGLGCFKFLGRQISPQAASNKPLFFLGGTRPQALLCPPPSPAAVQVYRIKWDMSRKKFKKNKNIFLVYFLQYPIFKL